MTSSSSDEEMTVKISITLPSVFSPISVGRDYLGKLAPLVLLDLYFFGKLIYLRGV